MSFNDVAVFVKENGCRIHFWYMSKDETINLLRNADLTGKTWNIIKHLLSHRCGTKLYLLATKKLKNINFTTIKI